MNFLTTESTEVTENEKSGSLAGKIIGASIDIQRALGLLESAYEACLIYELRLRKLKVNPQKFMPIFYKDVMQLLRYHRKIFVCFTQPCWYSVR